MTVQNQEQANSTVIVYSSILTNDGNDENDSNSKRIIFDQADTDKIMDIDNEKIELNAKDLITEVCNIKINDVMFVTYQKGKAIQDIPVPDYSIHLIVDTFVFSEIETKINNDKKLQFSKLAIQSSSFFNNNNNSNEDNNSNENTINLKHEYGRGKRKSSTKNSKLIQQNKCDQSNLVLSKILKKYDGHIATLKEIALPAKRCTADEVYDSKTEPNSKSIIPKLRHVCLLIPMKLSNNWSLIWVKFTKCTKLVEIFQIGTCKYPQNKLNYESQLVLKYLAGYILDLDDTSDLVFNYQYVFTFPKENKTKRALVNNIQCIIKGYQENGFNIDLSSLSNFTFESITKTTRITRQRSLLYLNLNEIRDINMQYVKTKRIKVPSPILSNNGNENQKRTRSATSKANTNTQSTKNNNINTSNNNINNNNPTTSNTPNNTTVIGKHTTHSNTSNSQIKKTTTNKANNNKPVTNNKPVKKKQKLSEPIIKTKRKTDASVSETPPPLSPLSLSKIVVNLENLEEIKKSINYDVNKMQELIKEYTKTYDDIEAYYLDKWARVTSFTDFTKNKFIDKEPPFLIYGPSQVEYEILKSNDIIATNSLKKKIEKYHVLLNTVSMRYLTSSRRWINQRFKLNKKIDAVFYTRDPNLNIPDYRDVPYIVLATHLSYGCLNSEDTFDIIHQNWYISRKMVTFILERCNRCGGRHIINT